MSRSYDFYKNLRSTIPNPSFKSQLAEVFFLNDIPLFVMWQTPPPGVALPNGTIYPTFHIRGITDEFSEDISGSRLHAISRLEYLLKMMHEGVK